MALRGATVPLLALVRSHALQRPGRLSYTALTGSKIAVFVSSGASPGAGCRLARSARRAVHIAGVGFGIRCVRAQALSLCRQRTCAKWKSIHMSVAASARCVWLLEKGFACLPENAPAFRTISFRKWIRRIRRHNKSASFAAQIHSVRDIFIWVNICSMVPYPVLRDDKALHPQAAQGTRTKVRVARGCQTLAARQCLLGQARCSVG